MTTHPSIHHDQYRLPESRVGWWCVALAGCTVGGVALEVLAFAVGLVEPAESYTDSWVQAGWGALIWASAVGALATGLVALFRLHERSWLVLTATLLGLLPVALLVSEIASGNF